MTRLVLLLLLLLLALSQTSWYDAAAAVTCRGSEALREILTLKHGEVVVYDAVTREGRLLEVYVNLDTGTWSIVTTTLPHISCVVYVGDGWRGPFVLKEEHHVAG